MLSVGISRLLGLIVTEFIIDPVLYWVGKILLGDVMIGEIVWI